MLKRLFKGFINKIATSDPDFKRVDFFRETYYARMKKFKERKKNPLNFYFFAFSIYIGSISLLDPYAVFAFNWRTTVFRIEVAGYCKRNCLACNVVQF